MRYGELLTVTQHGIKVPIAKLEPLGIYDKSQCFGIWLPNWVSESGPADEGAPENLLISPIPEQLWPVLVRVELRLSMDPESLSRAARALVKAGVNLITYDCTPSGYHHLTWTVTGTNDELVVGGGDAGILAKGRIAKAKSRSLHEGIRASEDLKAYASEDLGPPMLSFCKKVIDVVTTEHRREPFLHPAYLEQGSPLAGRLLDVDRVKDPDLRAEAESQQTRAVTCRWLQSPAYYWLYSLSRSVRRFEYHAASNSLRPQEQKIFTKQLEKWFSGFPTLKTLALFDSEETFVRVLFSSVDRDRRGVQITIPYVADLTVEKRSTKGLLQEVLGAVAEAGIRPLHVSHTTLQHGDSSQVGDDAIQQESNSILLVGDRRHLSVEEVRKKLDSRLCDPEMRAKVDRSDLRVGPLTGRQLFVSTKIMDGDWEAHKEMLRRMGPQAGFGLLFSDGPMEHKPSATGGFPTISNDVERKIFDSHAFLQIRPEGSGQKNSMWLDYELGLAIGRDLPCYQCIRSVGRNPMAGWKAKAIHPDALVTTFTLTNASFEKAIGEALAYLARALDERARHGSEV